MEGINVLRCLRDAMREFVFALTHEPSCNAVTDALAAHPGATVRSLACHATTDSLWRVDHASGSEAAIAAIEAAVLESEGCVDCLTTGDCGTRPETEVLDRGDESLVFYTRWERSDVCESVPHLALEHLGDGVLFETWREERQYTWRLILPEGTAVTDFFEALDDEVCEHTGIELLRLTELDEDDDATDDGDLPPAQREALTAAVAAGYYETPREVELSELADELDLPRSTLSYRLRRAEAQLATQYVEADGARVGAPQS